MTQTVTPRTAVRLRLRTPQATWLEAEAAARDLSPSRLVEMALAHLPDHLHGGPVVPHPAAGPS